MWILVITLLAVTHSVGFAEAGERRYAEGRSGAESRGRELVGCQATPIDWSPTRRLRIGDFRGPDGAKGLSAEASTGISSKSSGRMGAPTFTLEIRAYFEPCSSWMRSGERNAYTLAHEQVHFDITELFARRLGARYRAEIDSHAEFQREHNRIYEEVWRESRALQMQYDEEVYGQPEAQAEWIARVAALLEATPARADGRLTLPMG